MLPASASIKRSSGLVIFNLARMVLVLALVVLVKGVII